VGGHCEYVNLGPHEMRRLICEI